MTVVNAYEALSMERKMLQQEGLIPDWMATAGWQMFKNKYLYQATNVREQFERIAKTAAKHAPKAYPENWPVGRTWESAFFEIMWKGWMAGSTPVLANMGTERGCSVSCAGSVIDDSVLGFYDAYREVAMLTKEGFGTATDLSDIRPRGSPISRGGTAAGLVPVYEHFVQDMVDVSQGSNRRGGWAGYVDIEHGDFDELVGVIEKEPDGRNVGWIVKDKFVDKLNNGDKEAHRRFKKALKLKMVFGRGYFMFVDKVNRQRPQMYVDKQLYVKASQLCSEIMLHSSKDLTYTCVLSWMNDSKWDEWKDTDAVFVATVFLDCVVSDFIEKGSKIAGLEKAVASTVKGRAIGLGQGGLHTLFQKKMLPFEGFEAHMLSNQIAAHIDKQSLEASKWLASVLGEPEWCEGYGVRFTHRTAIAPTKSTALIYGGISEGIGPDMAMSFTQLTAAGEVDRINPVLLELIKKKGLDVEKCISDTVTGQGSVQHVDWLTPEEKLVFKTAFEIDQKAIIRMAAARQRRICQGQSLNLYFAGNASEELIAEVHQEAFENEDILSLYYIYSSRGVVSSSSGECLACQ